MEKVSLRWNIYSDKYWCKAGIHRADNHAGNPPHSTSSNFINKLVWQYRCTIILHHGFLLIPSMSYDSALLTMKPKDFSKMVLLMMGLIYQSMTMSVSNILVIMLTMTSEHWMVMTHFMAWGL